MILCFSGFDEISSHQGLLLSVIRVKAVTVKFHPIKNFDPGHEWFLQTLYPCTCSQYITASMQMFCL